MFLSKLNPLLYITLMAVPFMVKADMISMRDYIQLKTGMSEAEILYRVGPSDHESIYTDHYHNINRKIWYYIPEHHGSNAWITEITINRNGQIESLERYKARK